MAYGLHQNEYKSYDEYAELDDANRRLATKLLDNSVDLGAHVSSSGTGWRG